MKRSTYLLVFSVMFGVCASFADAQEPKPLDENNDRLDKKVNGVAEEPKESSPIAAYITVTHPVNERMFSRVRNTLLDLQNKAEQEERDAILILEIQRGSSMFGQVYELSKELRSSSYSRVRTVAWIPRDDERPRLDGYAAILALSCQEIVMHPDAELGDIGKGQALSKEEQLSVTNMANDGHNKKLDGALVAGFVDPGETILRIKTEKTENGEVIRESKIVTGDELRRLQESDIAILNVETVKETGDIGVLSGRRARALDVLVTQTAEDRTELPEQYGFDRRYLRESLTQSDKVTVQLIKITGTIDETLQEFVNREMRRAVANDVSIIIFEIDSPGGSYVISKQVADSIAELDSRKHRTIAYIPKMALSGGAMIALGCDEIYMAPKAQMGDIIPIDIKEGGWAERVPEKVLTVVRETLKSLAATKNRPPALLEAMADKDLAVFKCTHKQNGRVWYLSEAEFEAEKGIWIKEHMVPETQEGLALTVSGGRANELNLAETPVSDFSELKMRLGIPKDQVVKAAEQSWVDTLVLILKSPGATFLLFMIGIICIYLEVYTMTGFFGIGSALCFAVFFWSRFLGGTAGWLEVVLFIFGLALIALEIFVMPGFGVFGVSGGLAVVFALILASQTFVIPTTDEQTHQLSRTLGTLSGSIVACAAIAIVLGRYMPKMPGIKNMILAPASAAEGPLLDPSLVGSDQSPTSLIEQDVALLNQPGVAFTTLRPAGRAQINGKLIDVVSEGDFIDPGQQIEVIEVTGNRVVVRVVT
jgi:membrane-bound serine protease (ClpP class)